MNKHRCLYFEWSEFDQFLAEHALPRFSKFETENQDYWDFRLVVDGTTLDNEEKLTLLNKSISVFEGCTGVQSYHADENGVWLVLSQLPPYHLVSFEKIQEKFHHLQNKKEDLECSIRKLRKDASSSVEDIMKDPRISVQVLFEALTKVTEELKSLDILNVIVPIEYFTGGNQYDQR